MFREAIMKGKGKPQIERIPSRTSITSFGSFSRRRISVESMTSEDNDGAENLNYESTLVST